MGSWWGQFASTAADAMQLRCNAPVHPLRCIHAALSLTAASHHQLHIINRISSCIYYITNNPVHTPQACSTSIAPNTSKAYNITITTYLNSIVTNKFPDKKENVEQNSGSIKDFVQLSTIRSKKQIKWAMNQRRNKDRGLV